MMSANTSRDVERLIASFRREIERALTLGHRCEVLAKAVILETGHLAVESEISPARIRPMKAESQRS